jgi:hypothetical protein
VAAPQTLLEPVLVQGVGHSSLLLLLLGVLV